MKIFLTGATGLVGLALADELLAGGHEVLALSRSPTPRGLAPGVRVVQGDPALAGPWQEELARCEACVNLAGEPVAGGRWTRERKARIRDSRVLATRNVAEVVSGRGPAVLVNGSAVGLYGSRGDELLDESSEPGHDFLAETCKAWEAEAAPAARRARVVLLRTGLVLARRGGVLEQLVRPFKLFAGGPLGDGAFWQSWIHVADEIGLILWALGNPAVSGPLVAAAPAPVRNRDLARAIGKVLHRPSFLPAPVAALRLALGEMAEVVLASQRLLPRKALDLGYRFRFERIEDALRDLLGP